MRTKRGSSEHHAKLSRMMRGNTNALGHKQTPEDRAAKSAVPGADIRVSNAR